MSTFKVPFVRIGKVSAHPNADSLSITSIEGCPVVFKTGDFAEGQAAIYVPVDGVIPETVKGTEFLGKKRRIRAMRLRGIFSMGLLLDPEVVFEPMGQSYEIGTDLAGKLGISKYEEPEPVFMQTDAASPPPTKIQPPVYDMESYRKFKHLLTPGEFVVVTEKLHGTNSRFVFTDALHVGSHRGWKKMDERNLWWKIAEKYELAHALSKCPGLVFYGETYGQVQDLKYGKNTNELAIFDIYDSNEGRWLDSDHVFELCEELGLPMVPEVYRGEYIPEVVEGFADGESTVPNSKNIREGVVIKPLMERYNPETGRTILKLVSEAYLLRKGGTEFH